MINWEADFMEFQMTDDVLTIFLSGRIKADNASAVDAELSKIIKSNPSNALVLDATDLEYIASAGLRVLMKCRKASKKKVAIQNVSKAVFDVLEMTSFTKLFEVSKKPREISIDGCSQVGMGLSSKVYRIDPETIVKVYDRKVPFYKISREIDLAKKAFVLGVPTAISYDLVRVGEAYGVVFEMIADAKAVGDALQANDCRDFDEIMKKFATLLKTLHQTEATKDSGLPSIKGTWLDWAKGMSAYYTQEEYDMLRRMIEEIPDRNTLVHCDFHAGNTLYQDGEVVVIDMADFGFGHPVFDFAAGSFHKTMRHGENFQRSLNLSEENILRFWNTLLEMYFETKDRTRLDEIDQTFHAFALLRGALFPMKHVQISPEARQFHIDNARKNFFPQFDWCMEQTARLKTIL